MDRTTAYSPETAKLNQAANGGAPKRSATSIDAVEDTLLFARNIASRVQTLADYMLGGEPTCGAAGTEEIASGVLPQLAQNASETRRRLSEASSALDRIQSSLP